MWLDAYLLIKCDYKSPQSRTGFLEHGIQRQDGGGDGASQYMERKCFSNKCQVPSVSPLQPQSYWKSRFLKGGVGVDVKMLQELIFKASLMYPSLWVIVFLVYKAGKISFVSVITDATAVLTYTLFCPDPQKWYCILNHSRKTKKWLIVGYCRLKQREGDPFHVTSQTPFSNIYTLALNSCIIVGYCF